MAKRNVVLGTIKDYEFDVVNPFLSTLHSTGYSGDVVLFHCNIAERTVARLRRMGVILVPFQDSFPYLEPTLAKHIGWGEDRRIQTLDIYCLRHLLAYCYLKELANEYQHIMLTDIRDVIFQKDPFDFPIGGRLCCFMEREGISFRGQSMNAEWMEIAFNGSTLERFYDNAIVCVGVTIGPSHLIIDYLTKMIDLFTKAPGMGWGTDQAVHNYLVHDGLLPKIRLYENNNGPVLTLGLEDQVLVDCCGVIINKRGDIPNIVHQYDRHWQVAKRFYTFQLIWKRSRVRAGLSRMLRARTPRMYRALVRVRQVLSRSQCL